MKNKGIYMVLVLFLFMGYQLAAQSYAITSPDGELNVEINTKDQLSFQVKRNATVLIPKVSLGMDIEELGFLGQNAKVKRVNKTEVNETIKPVIPIKNAEIKDVYSQIEIDFKGNWSVTFRVYDDAVAYKFSTDKRGEITVVDEQSDISFPADTKAWFSVLEGKDTVERRWWTSYEKVYQHKKIDELQSGRVELPILADLGDSGKVLITEAHLYDYPGLYFTGGDNNSLKGVLPPRVKSWHTNKKENGWGWDRTILPKEVYTHIAKTEEKRDFPWRILGFAKDDKALLNNEIVFKLAEPNRLQNTDWIKPGLVTWDWWNNWNIIGVDFKTGINNKTYEYYIDFAADHNIPYIIMDDGWYELGDLTKEAKDIDVKHLVDYAKEKNVDIILWASWMTLNSQMTEALDLFESWGIKGIKVDFMDRDDQETVNFYWKAAEEAAKRHLMVDFHGSHKPTGLNRTYPNVMTYEGVAGLEQVKWSDDYATPEMAVSIPFIRMFTGPMDYTPGAMRNAQKSDFRINGNSPMSWSTRVQQIAMYILYESPLQMLSDTPSNYLKNEESLTFMSKIPTTWDKTIPLSGKVGEYVALARKKGEEYYVAAMTNDKQRDIEIDFSFLPAGDWKIEIMQDGVNAEKNAEDYKRIEDIVSHKDKQTVHLSTGGGWAARIYK